MSTDRHHERALIVLASAMMAVVLLAPAVVATRAQTIPAGAGHAPASGPADAGTGVPSADPDASYAAAPRSDRDSSPYGDPDPHALGAATPGLRVQYLLSMSANFGTVSPGNGWYDAGTVVPITATPPTGTATERYSFQNWTGDYQGTAPSGSITMDGNKTVRAVWVHQFQTALGSSPTGQSLVADGTLIATPAILWWAEGTSHILIAPASVAVGADIRLSFASWSPGGGTNTQFTVSSVFGPATYTAAYTRQFRVTILTAPAAGPTVLVDAVPYTTPVWFDEGTTHMIDAGANPQSGGTGTQYVFKHWDTNSATPIRPYTATAPWVITATYDTQYRLTVTSIYGNPVCVGAADPNGCWYLAGSTATASVTSPFVGQDGRAYEIQSWSGDAAGAGPSVSVTMDGPRSVTATWRDIGAAVDLSFVLGFLLGGFAIAGAAGLFAALILRERRRSRPPPTWPGYPPP